MTTCEFDDGRIIVNGSTFNEFSLAHNGSDILVDFVSDGKSQCGIYFRAADKVEYQVAGTKVECNDSRTAIVIISGDGFRWEFEDVAKHNLVDDGM